MSVMCETLMDKYLNKSWTMKINNNKRMFGYCWYRKKQIEMSRVLTELNDEETVKNTILHEIAHALLPPKVGHGIEWKNLHRKLGGNGKRCYSNEVKKEEGKHHAICPKCSQRFEIYRLTRSWLNGNKYHTACGPNYKLILNV